MSKTEVSRCIANCIHKTKTDRCPYETIVIEEDGKCRYIQGETR